ncbi:hypothetical protein CR513_28525, partial [Mucuna pruriens]
MIQTQSSTLQCTCTVKRINSILGFIPYTLCFFVVLIEGHKNRLVNLYKDIKSFGEYEDIRVTWKMIQTQSSTPQRTCTVKRINRHKNGLVNLYKDMQSFGEYEDIRVMWKMIQTQSSTPQCTCTVKRINRSSYWILCFRPT